MMPQMKLSIRRGRRYGLVAAVALGVLSIRTAAQQASPTTDAQYSEAQATRGDAVYVKYCRGCHGPQLAGTEFGPGVTGAEFNARWKTRPTRELFDVIRSTMPVNSPGGLRAEEFAEVTAFLLKRAGFPAGKSDFSPRADASASTARAPSSGGSSAAPVGYYSDVQASRGRALFLRHCAFCHRVDASTAKTDAQPDRGFVVGNTLGLRDIGTKSFPSVYHLFRRIRDAMPEWDIDSATNSEKRR